jgi:glutamate--cysteine ligase catalytic subunit
MDIQITDFENSCLIVLMGMITNIINHFDVDFIIPITLSDENMKRAHYRDALLNEKFWFNVNCVSNKDTYTKSKL